MGAALAAKAVWFIFFEIAVYSAILATFGSAIVMVAEALPIAQRSEGQGWANLVIASGGGICVVLAPVLARAGLSWRWLPALVSRSRNRAGADDASAVAGEPYMEAGGCGKRGGQAKPYL